MGTGSGVQSGELCGGWDSRPIPGTNLSGAIFLYEIFARFGELICDIFMISVFFA